MGATVVTLLLVPSGTWVALDVRRSSLRTTPDGVAAWSRSLERLGAPIKSRFTSFTADPPGMGALVLLEPVQPPSAAEVREVLEWMRAGGVLVYSPRFESLVMDSLGLVVSIRSFGPGADGPPGIPHLLPHRWTNGVQEDTLVANWAIQANEKRAKSWIPLAELDSASATLAWLPEGSGGALVLAEAGTLANQDLASSAVAEIVTRAVLDLVPPGDTIAFAEYHQAQDGRRGIFRESYALAAASPVGRVLMHVAVASILLLILSGRSFGAPVPEPEADRRSPLEHVDALGHIYETSSSDHAVARRLVLGAVRRLGRRPVGAEDETEILEAWSRLPDLGSPARSALDALRTDPPDLARLSATLDTIVNEYTPRHRET
ncbi:MAG: DUF4350 domain-containing protein [Gemmatimonadota bacterium]